MPLTPRHPRRIRMLGALLLTAAMLSLAGSMTQAGKDSATPSSNSLVVPKNARELSRALKGIEQEADRKTLDLTRRYVDSDPADKTLDQAYMRLLWSARNLKDHAAFIEYAGKFEEAFGATHPHAEYVRSLRVAAMVDTLDLKQAQAAIDDAVAARISTGTGVEQAFVKCANLYAINGQFNEARKVIDRIAELPDSTKVVEASRRWQGMLERPFPHFEGRGPNGETIQTDDLAKGKKLTIVCFWATWCPTCVEDQETLAAWLKKHGTERVQLIGVNVDSAARKSVKGTGIVDTSDTVRAAVKELGISWPQILATEGWKSASLVQSGVVALPSMFVIDEFGRTIATDFTSDMLDLLAEKHLAPKKGRK